MCCSAGDGSDRKRETASPGADVLAGAQSGTRTATLMTERKSVEEEEEAAGIWATARLSLGGCQHQKPASVQSASLIPQFSSVFTYRQRFPQQSVNRKYFSSGKKARTHKASEDEKDGSLPRFLLLLWA